MGDLEKLFGGIGTIARSPIKREHLSWKFLKDENDAKGRKGTSKGFQDEWPLAIKLYKPGKEGGDAQVEYTDRLAAKAAVNTFNGFKLKDNSIGVKYAGQGQVFEQRELTLPWHLREENKGKMADGMKIHDAGAA